MGNYRTVTILAQESATTAATKTIDLDVVNAISRITLVYRPTNSNTTLIGHPALCITKVEIVDGSDVIFSATGKELRAVAYYGTGEPLFDVLSYNISDQCIPGLPIYFGRYLFDPDLALDPKRFTNLQLKITHNEALGGSTPTSSTLAVYADVFDEKRVSPIGFLMTKEQYNYLPTASAHNYIDLDVSYPYRLILIGGHSSGKAPNNRFNKVKLSEDFDRKIPIPETSVSDLLKGIVNLFPPMVERIITPIAITATTVYTTIGYEGLQTGSGFGGTAIYTSAGNIVGGSYSLYGNASGTAVSLVNGFCPHNYMALPICDQDNISDFYNVTTLKSLRLDVTNGSSPGTSDSIYIVTQQLRRY